MTLFQKPSNTVPYIPSRIMHPPRIYVTYVKFPRKMVFPSKEATPDEEDAEDEGAEAFDDID